MSDPRCEEFRELASAWADDELRSTDLLRLERHLETCADCRAFDGGLRRVRELLRAGEALRPLRRPPPGFAAAVAARAAAGAAPALVAFPARPRLRARAGIAAAAAAAALLFAWTWQRLAPGDAAAPLALGEPVEAVGVRTAGATMDDYLHRHAMLARDATLLGQAEEVEFAVLAGGAR